MKWIQPLLHRVIALRKRACPRTRGGQVCPHSLSHRPLHSKSPYIPPGPFLLHSLSQEKRRKMICIPAVLHRCPRMRLKAPRSLTTRTRKQANQTRLIRKPILGLWPRRPKYPRLFYTLCPTRLPSRCKQGLRALLPLEHPASLRRTHRNIHICKDLPTCHRLLGPPSPAPLCSTLRRSVVYLVAHPCQARHPHPKM